MALPNTGPLSGDQIDREFPDTLDGGRPMSLSEYRGVITSKDGLTYTLPPSPNPISYSDFRGISYGYFIDVLIVGGGGGGGGGFVNPNRLGVDRGLSGGGGGAGGLIISNNLFVTPGNQFSVIVGPGGLGKPSGDVPGWGFRGDNGGSSSFDYNGTIYTANGGGGGGGARAGQGSGANGGSGGGASGGAEISPGGTGNQGKNGGIGDRTLNSEGGGGGGYRSSGLNGAINGPDGVGGSGYNLNQFMGTANYRGNNGGIAGGGGGGRTTDPEGGAPGNDGGGNGAFRSLGISLRGQSNDGANLTGGGGGGGCEGNGSSRGGSGVVIIRYSGNSKLGNGGTTSTGIIGSRSYYFHIFGLNGTFTA
jgi:fibronectin-binding autotransporter adhesin